MTLSPHLTEREFLSTQHRALVEEQLRTWQASQELHDNAQRFAVSCFEQVRQHTGPLHVTSGYRCPALNAAVGGVHNSRHMLALAADVVPLETTLTEGFERIRKALKSGWLPSVDKVIIECGSWIHFQAALAGEEPRRIALVTDDTVHFRTA
jgi:hypothetical protein